jgi:hypothetical protein
MARGHTEDRPCSRQALPEVRGTGACDYPMTLSSDFTMLSNLGPGTLLALTLSLNDVVLPQLLPPQAHAGALGGTSLRCSQASGRLRQVQQGRSPHRRGGRRDLAEVRRVSACHEQEESAGLRLLCAQRSGLGSQTRKARCHQGRQKGYDQGGRSSRYVQQTSLRLFSPGGPERHLSMGQVQ